MIHTIKSPLAGRTVKIKSCVEHPQQVIAGEDYRVEDWWDRVSGGSSWMDTAGNPACLIYAMRTGFSKIPIPNDDEVLYGKVGCLGHLIHISEIEI